MQMLCSEPGHWPESIGQLDAEALEALIEHATDCSYHLSLLDQDEEEFLLEFKQTASLLLQTGTKCHTSRGRKTCFSTDMESDGNDVLRADGLTAGAVDLDYANYRRWKEEQCPLEIMEVRSGDRAVCTFDIVRDGGSWRFAIDVDDEALQFWTFCRRHQDRVRIGACDLPASCTVQSEASTLYYTNGQSISVRFSGVGKNAFGVLLHCTAPRPAGLRYSVYNFDSLLNPADLDAHQYSKSSEVSSEFARFAEWRLPVRDLEAAHIQDGRTTNKRVNELMRVIGETEPIQPHAPPFSSNALMLRELHEESNRPTQLVKQLKKWVACERSSKRQLYSFSSTASVKFQICGLRKVSNGKNLRCEERSMSFFVFPIRQREPLFVELCSLDFLRPSRDESGQLLRIPERNENFSKFSAGYRRIVEDSPELNWEPTEFAAINDLSRSSICSSVSMLARCLWTPIKRKRFQFLAEPYESISEITVVSCLSATGECCAQLRWRDHAWPSGVSSYASKGKSQLEQVSRGDRLDILKRYTVAFQRGPHSSDDVAQSMKHTKY